MKMVGHRRMKHFSILLVSAAVLAEAATSVAGPLDYSGGFYTQNFNGLPTNITNPLQNLTTNLPVDFTGNVTAVSGMDGWQLANPGGSSAITEFKSQDGSAGGSGGRGVISLGTNGSTDRALGFISTSNQVGRVGLLLRNNTESTTFTRFYVSFYGELWRRGDIDFPNVDELYDDLNFEYGEGNDINTDTTAGLIEALSFTGPSTSGYAALPVVLPKPSGYGVDGNNSEYRKFLDGTITGIDWAPGETLVLRWTGTDFTGQDDGLGVDDLSFVAATGPSLLLGDFNQDYSFTNLDIQALINALNDVEAYKLAKGIDENDFKTFGDINNSGDVGEDDIAPLLRLLAGNGPLVAGVPEPSAFSLGAVSILGLLMVRARIGPFRKTRRLANTTRPPVAN